VDGGVKTGQPVAAMGLTEDLALQRALVGADAIAVGAMRAAGGQQASVVRTAAERVLCRICGGRGGVSRG